MAVQCVKWHAIGVVLQGDGRAVVEMGVVVTVTVYDAVEWRVNRRSGWQKQVDADVNGAPFGKFVALLRECVGGIG